MLSLSMYFKYVAVMAAVTYLLRALPFVLVKKKITNIYIRSFLEYIVFTSAGAWIPSLAGMTVALILAYRRKGLLTVAIGAVAAAAILTIVI